MRRRWLAAILMWGLGAGGPAVAQQFDFANVEALIKAGKAAAAYQVLEPLEFDRAGEPDFDYWLGLAALEAGRPDRATLALERVLAVNPQFTAARLDLARAYFALGDYARARTELTTVLALDPPPAARETAERHLRAIEERRRRLQIVGYAEAAVGRDSNVNNSTGQSQVFVPLFGTTLTLNPTNVRRPDSYAVAGGGFDANYSLSDAAAVFVAADVRDRMNARADTFDNAAYDVRGGMRYRSGSDFFQAYLNSGRYYLDNKYYRTGGGLNLEWRRTLDARNELGVFGVAGRVRYADTGMRSNDINPLLAGVSWQGVVDERTRTTVRAGAFVGYEDSVNNRIDGDKKSAGVRLLGQTAIHPDADAFVALGAQVGDFQRQNSVFSTTRRDWQYDVTAALGWRFARDWELRPQAVFIRNRSNVVINAYDRYDISMAVRRSFR